MIEWYGSSFEKNPLVSLLRAFENYAAVNDYNTNEYDTKPLSISGFPLNGLMRQKLSTKAMSEPKMYQTRDGKLRIESNSAAWIESDTIQEVKP